MITTRNEWTEEWQGLTVAHDDVRSKNQSAPLSKVSTTRMGVG